MLGTLGEEGVEARGKRGGRGYELRLSNVEDFDRGKRKQFVTSAHKYIVNFFGESARRGIAGKRNGV